MDLSANALRCSSASRSWLAGRSCGLPDRRSAFGPLVPLEPLAGPAAGLALFLVFTARAMRVTGIPKSPKPSYWQRLVSSVFRGRRDLYRLYRSADFPRSVHQFNGLGAIPTV